MDRDVWLTSSSNTLGAVLATQSNVDDVLRAAANAPEGKGRRVGRIQRRLRKAAAVEATTAAVVGSAEVLADSSAGAKRARV